MSNELSVDQHDVPLELYLSNIKRFAGSFPTFAEVEAAILAFCPLNPVTGDILAKQSVSNLRVLTTLLYMPFYPELLGILATPLFVAKCLVDIEEYLQRHKLFDQAYGLLMLKLFSLGNMAGILAQVAQLKSFNSSLLGLRLKGQKNLVKITTELLNRTNSVLQDQMKASGGFFDLHFWNQDINLTVDGQPKHEEILTAKRSCLLLDRLWEQRDLMVTTFARSPTPGFSTVLLVLSSNQLNSKLSEDEASDLISRSLDLIVRYTLVATVEESAIVQGQCHPKGTTRLHPVNLDDRHVTTKLLLQQLSSMDQQDSFSARHAAFMLLQFADSLRVQGDYKVGISIMKAGMQLFWRVCLHPKRREEVWDKRGPFAFEPVALFNELVTATASSKTARALIPEALSTLYSIEFFDWCGRLVLLPMLLWPDVISGLHTDEEQSKKRETWPEKLTHLSLFVDELSPYASLLQPIEKKAYHDWAKIYDFTRELRCRFQPSARMYPYVKELVQVWARLGDVFGYLTELQRHQGLNMCSYARCIGYHVRGVEQLVCELLALLTTPIFVAKCLMDVEEYLQDHKSKVFDQAYGFLILKILALGNMVSLLEHADQLGSFVNSMLLDRVQKKDTLDFTAALVSRTAYILECKIKASGGFVGLSFWNQGFGITIDGQPKQEGYFTVERSRILLGRLWEQRDLLLTTLVQSLVPGFAAFLLVIASNALKDLQIELPE
ncbi:hypothetical protein BDV93DRAFT_562873 [Ceratobasidium sp. AG-I]|nr:hypothetical protein BDV93DRAFT_562873 [Ceratobasidium sp. AG-I]